MTFDDFGFFSKDDVFATFYWSKSIMILQILYLKYVPKILEAEICYCSRDPLIRCCHSFAVLESRP